MNSILHINIQITIDKWTDNNNDANEEFVQGIVTKIKNNEITLDEYLVSPTIVNTLCKFTPNPRQLV